MSTAEQAATDIEAMTANQLLEVMTEDRSVEGRKEESLKVSCVHVDLMQASGVSGDRRVIFLKSPRWHTHGNAQSRACGDIVNGVPGACEALRLVGAILTKEEVESSAVDYQRATAARRDDAPTNRGEPSLLERRRSTKRGYIAREPQDRPSAARVPGGSLYA